MARDESATRRVPPFRIPCSMPWRPTSIQRSLKLVPAGVTVATSPRRQLVSIANSKASVRGLADSIYSVVQCFDFGRMAARNVASSTVPFSRTLRGLAHAGERLTCLSGLSRSRIRHEKRAASYTWLITFSSCGGKKMLCLRLIARGGSFQNRQAQADAESSENAGVSASGQSGLSPESRRIYGWFFRRSSVRAHRAT